MYYFIGTSLSPAAREKPGTSSSPEEPILRVPQKTFCGTKSKRPNPTQRTGGSVVERPCN